MKAACLIWFLYFGLLSNLFAKTELSEEDLAQYAKEVADKLRAAIWDEWDVTVQGNTVKVQSKFDIYWVKTEPQAFMPPPPLKPEATLEEVRSRSAPYQFIVKLRLEKPLTREEYLKRRNDRQMGADAFNIGPPPSLLSQWKEQHAKIQEAKINWDDLSKEEKKTLNDESFSLFMAQQDYRIKMHDQYRDTEVPRFKYKQALIYREIEPVEKFIVKNQPPNVIPKIGAVKGIIDLH